MDPDPTHDFLKIAPPVDDPPRRKLQGLADYLAGLEAERRKVEAFERELPLCLGLLNDAVERFREELRKCREAVDRSFDKVRGPNSENDDDDRKNWMSSVQLWNPHPDDSSEFNSSSSNLDLMIGGCFGDGISLVRLCGENVRNPGKALINESKMQKRIQHQQAQQLVCRKQRRCWSLELHQRFVDALKQLGGFEVATPKQIRDIMRVEGLTNDEVKSHLQKYRLHFRKAPSTPMPATSNGPTASRDDQLSTRLHSKSHSMYSPQGPLGRSSAMLDEGGDDENEGHSWRNRVIFRPACMPTC
uniref:HTH myb-type domain-containing protein n=1 Tax=Kalanchoe fedtschenkoi TaxID=63787 RepID=A0A7N0TAE3_KALFE